MSPTIWCSFDCWCGKSQTVCVLERSSGLERKPELECRGRHAIMTVFVFFYVASFCPNHSTCLLWQNSAIMATCSVCLDLFSVSLSCPLCHVTASLHFCPHFLFGVHSPAAHDCSSRKRKPSQSRTGSTWVILVSLFSAPLSSKNPLWCTFGHFTMLRSRDTVRKFLSTEIVHQIQITSRPILNICPPPQVCREDILPLHSCSFSPDGPGVLRELA